MLAWKPNEVVYSIAFIGDKFVMVFNPSAMAGDAGVRSSRGDAEQAAIREVREECGCSFIPSPT